MPDEEKTVDIDTTGPGADVEIKEEKEEELKPVEEPVEEKKEEVKEKQEASDEKQEEIPEEKPLWIMPKAFNMSILN